MVYVNRYTDEEYEDYDECRQDLITMQESGKSDLLDTLAWTVHNEEDKEEQARLKAGLDFIKACIRIVEDDYIDNEDEMYDDHCELINPFIVEMNKEDE